MKFQAAEEVLNGFTAAFIAFNIFTTKDVQKATIVEEVASFNMIYLSQ